MKTEQVFITCDECQTIDASELRFAINGRNFAIDLCTMHRAVFDTLIQPYVANGHPVRFNNHSVRKDAPKTKVETPKPTKRARSRKAVAVKETEETTNG